MLGLTGRTVSHYHFLDQIGQGGMSSVFRGVDLRDQRAVAIKVLSPYIAHETRFKARFEREIRLLRRLQHPHIMPILDFGEVDDLAFIVMPYVGTGTLQDRLTRSPLSPQEGGRIVEQLASALEAAHAAGVIHRDVKPSNVLIDPMGNALLSDFSFAHQMDASQNLTGSALIGTPAYMSPEQCRGEPIDARSDQYAFAVMLYQITTGRLPFEADTPMAIALKHVNEPLPRPRQVNPNLPEDVEFVLIKGLAKDPANRYASLADLNTAFQQALADATDPARQAAARTRDLDRTTAIYNKYQNVRPPARRRWYERTVVVAVLLALLLFPAMAAAGAAIFFPELLNGGASAASAPPDVYATVGAVLTARAPGATEIPPGRVATAVAMLETAQALGAVLEQDQVEAIVLAGADLSGPTATPTPTVRHGQLPIPPTATRTLEPGESPPPPSPTFPPTGTFTPGPSPTPSLTGAASATTTGGPTSSPTSGGGGPTPVSTGVGPTPTSAPPTPTSAPSATRTNTPAPSNTAPPPPPTATPKTINPNACKTDSGHPNYCTPTPPP